MVMSELPEDLKQLRSVCKRWNRLFDDMRFTRKHFDKSPKQFMILITKHLSVCSMSVNLHRIPQVTGKFSLIDPHISLLDHVEIWRVSHCDGLLLCVCVPKEPLNTGLVNTGLVVWNPCTGQTRWIQPSNLDYGYGAIYALGTYQDKNSNDSSYKILRIRGYGDNVEYEIYEINSNSWRVLDVTVDFLLYALDRAVSLKGKSFLIAKVRQEQLGNFCVVSFDYTTERFERLCLPLQYPWCQILSLSVVREENLSVLLQRIGESKTEVWVTNKIGETKVMSWTMVLAVDLRLGLATSYIQNYVVDDEKKVLVCCDSRILCKDKTTVYIVGEDNNVKKVDSDVGSSRPLLLHYVPSLTQI